MNKKIACIITASISVILFVYVNSNINKKTIKTYSNSRSLYSFTIVKDEFIEEYEIKLKELEELRIKEEQERIERELQLLREKEIEEERIRNVTYEASNLLITSGLKEEELYEILPQSMKHLAYSIVGAERQYGISAFFITSIAALESNWATSSRAKYSNNLTGMAVYGDDSPGTYYNSQYECIYDTARQLKKYYLSSDGIFHNGYSSYSVNINYCTSSDWYIKIDKIAYELLDKYDKIFRGNL